jgi:hypothetical protein
MFSASTYGLAKFLQRDVFLQITSCPVCLEVRGFSYQMVSGVAVPTFLATVGVNQFMHSTDRSTFSPFRCQCLEAIQIIRDIFLHLCDSCFLKTIFSLVRMMNLKESVS